MNELTDGSSITQEQTQRIYEVEALFMVPVFQHNVFHEVDGFKEWFQELLDITRCDHDEYEKGDWRSREHPGDSSHIVDVGKHAALYLFNDSPATLRAFPSGFAAYEEDVVKKDEACRKPSFYATPGQLVAMFAMCAKHETCGKSRHLVYLH